MKSAGGVEVKASQRGSSTIAAFFGAIIALIAATFGLQHVPVATASQPTAATQFTTQQIQDLSGQATPSPALSNEQKKQIAVTKPARQTIIATQQSPSSLQTITSVAGPASALALELAQLHSLGTQLQSEVASLPADNPASTSYLTVPAWAASQRIDQLTDTTLNSVTVNGISGLTAGDIPDLSSSYLSTSGGTVNGDLTVTGNLSGGALALTDASSTNASSTNLFSTNATLTDATSTSFFSALGTFTNGVINSLTSSLADITDLTATNATTTNATTTNLGISSVLTFSGNRTYSGAAGIANSFMYMPGSALFGTASAAPNGIISPFNLYISGDTVNTTSSGNGNLIDFSVEGAVGNGHTGGREAFQSYLNIVGTPSTTPGAAGYVGGQFMLRGSANLLGTGGAYANYAGGAFASNANIYLTSGATFYKTVNAEEFDVTVPIGASTADKYGISIVQGSNDAVRGAYDDSAISINDQDGASAPWHYGISFGSYAHQWAFATDSTLIMAQQRQAGPSSPSIALNGVDFRNVTFGGYAFASPGFSVDGSGNIVGADLYASSTLAATFGGDGAGAGVIASATSSSQTSGSFSTAFGYNALGNATSSAYESVAMGYDALLSSSAISSLLGNNTAVGYEALKSNSSGSDNVGLGSVALESNTTGANNTGVGTTVLFLNTTGSANTAIGRQALSDNTSGIDNTAIGALALLNTQTTSNNTAVGVDAGEGASNNSFSNDSLFGENAGFSLTTGSNNIFLGYNSGSSTASGNFNIALGDNIDLPSTNGSNQLDIGNLIFGTGVNGTYSTVSTGDIAIGTTTPYSRLIVWGPDTASTSAFAVVNSASTTVFAAYDNGNATYSGSIFQSSDQRLKTNIIALDASSSLSAIESLNPVSYLRLDQPGTGENLGFIAQQVQQIFPQLVSTSTPTALTPDGTLTLNYEGLISPMVSAIQDIASITGDFETNLIAWLGDTSNGIGALFAQNIYATKIAADDVTANQEFCVGDGSNDPSPVCITKSQLAAILNAAGGQISPESVTSSPASSSPGSVTSSTSTDATDTPPVILINGNNPAIVSVGGAYTDLGAQITGPQGDLNLGIEASVDNGATTTLSAIEIDTSAPGTHTITYSATDESGLTGTATRTVIVEAATTTPTTTSTTTPS